MGYIGNQSTGITYTNINTFRGKVADLTALSTASGMMSGDVYVTEDNNHAHMYTGTAWVDLGEIRGPQGPVGPQGIAGAGVSTVVRTTGDGSAGTTDVYTITYNDATTSIFEVYNGTDGIPGIIDHVAQTAGDGTQGTTDTYTMYGDAGETKILGTFNVYNGYNGVASTVDSLVDVDLTTVPVEDGQTIVWNEVEGKWMPGDVSSSAINTTYDNTTSELTATDVQGAIDEIENSINDIENSVVKKTGDQTIEDIKTFTSSPIVPTPTTDFQAATKEYVDSASGITSVKTALNASGAAPIYACRAWVNFNGTGTVAIRASGNVSSITDNGTGDYTVNFTTAMPDVNYTISQMGQGGFNIISAADLRVRGTISEAPLTTSSVRLHNQNTSDTILDSSQCFVQIFR